MLTAAYSLLLNKLMACTHTYALTLTLIITKRPIITRNSNIQNDSFVDDSETNSVVDYRGDVLLLSSSS